MNEDEKLGYERERREFKKLRHGVGVQVFYRPDNSIMCKYEGHWVKGKKCGQGVTTYPDQSVFIGKNSSILAIFDTNELD